MDIRSRYCQNADSDAASSACSEGFGGLRRGDLDDASPML